MSRMIFDPPRAVQQQQKEEQAVRQQETAVQAPSGQEVRRISPHWRTVEKHSWPLRAGSQSHLSLPSDDDIDWHTCHIAAGVCIALSVEARRRRTHGVQSGRG